MSYAATDPFSFGDGMRYGDVTRVGIRRSAIDHKPPPKPKRGFGFLPMLTAVLSIGCMGYCAGLVLDAGVAMVFYEPAPSVVHQPVQVVQSYGFTL
jgi:hypothetical protein